MTSVFQAPGPVIDHEFRHDIVKVAVDPLEETLRVMLEICYKKIQFIPFCTDLSPIEKYLTSDATTITAIPKKATTSWRKILRVLSIKDLARVAFMG